MGQTGGFEILCAEQLASRPAVETTGLPVGLAPISLPRWLGLRLPLLGRRMGGIHPADGGRLETAAKAGKWEQGGWTMMGSR